MGTFYISKVATRGSSLVQFLIEFKIYLADAKTPSSEYIQLVIITNKYLLL